MIRRIGTMDGVSALPSPPPRAVVANGLVFTSGQVPLRSVPEVENGNFADDVRLALANLSAILEESGSSLKHVLKITTFLTDPRLADYNEIYVDVFGDNLPARTTVMVSESDYSIEIHCIAAVADGHKPPLIRRITNALGMAPVLGPYSQAVVANGMVFTSGQIPARTSMQDQPEDFAGKVRQTLTNLEAILLEAGSDLAHVAKVTTYLTDPEQLAEYNRVYAEVFGSTLPARTSCCVGIWDIALEIECIAFVADGPSQAPFPQEPELVSATQKAGETC
ncbi:RidA family protein [Pseudarthrobacter sulfonivorans]|uniref:RidA family protein n=1 Tax=Pseudarthrobacter sulfonivorans TaxID=121292 RepID=UPI000A99977F|nr:RidA family protein [Pseudarthrobacter sulfonivorans]